MQLSRRQLLKWSLTGMGLGAGGRRVAALLDAGRLIPGGKQVSRTTGKSRGAIPSTCLACPARCGILCFVEQGRLVKIEGNPEHPNNRGRICARGQAGLNLLYDPERLVHPLERVGPRGAGEWREISWEDALRKLATRLNVLRAEGWAHQLVLESGEQSTVEPLVTRFLRAFGAPEAFYTDPVPSPNKTIALALNWGAYIDVNDVAHTKYILNFGANPYESHPSFVGLVQRMAEGRAKGARLVTFDPRLSNTAGRSDEWLPVTPGTDALVALAMAHVIVKEGLYDADFLSRWTNCSLPRLAKHLQSYTPALAQEIAGVPADDVQRIAREFATTKPATTISGGGVSEHENGVQNERCVALLNALTGNVDVKGGYCLPRTCSFREVLPAPPAPKGEDSPLGQGLPAEANDLLVQIAEGRRKVGVYMARLSNPVYSHADTKWVTKLLGNQDLIPYFVVIDTHLTETAFLADLILPTTTYLESWDLESPPSYDMRPLVSLRQPVVKPVAGTRSLAEILLEIVKRLDGSMRRYFPLATVPDYLEVAISGLHGLTAAGGLPYLREHGVWQDENARPTYRSYEASGFRTTSGKFEVHSPTLERLGASPLPTYEPTASHENMAADQLALITFQWNVHTDGRTSNCKWLSEITHNNPLYINPETAGRHGISHGDYVRVSSQVGSLTTKAHCTEGIHPGVIAIGDSCGHWRMGCIAQAKRFSSEDPDTSLLWWDEIGSGKHPNQIIPVTLDPVGKGQGWMDTVVTVRKAT